MGESKNMDKGNLKGRFRIRGPVLYIDGKDLEGIYI